MNEEERRQYAEYVKEAANNVNHDMQIAKQLAVKLFGVDVKPEVVVALYDRMLQRLTDMFAPQEEEPGEGEEET